MGWTFIPDYCPFMTRAQMIDMEFTHQPIASNPTAWGFHSLAERGSTVYAIAWRQAPSEARHYFGCVFLTQRKRGEFGYKEMDESMGPYYFDMPVRMLEALEALAPTEDTNARAWRDRVRQHHIAKRKRGADVAVAGQLVRFHDGGDVYRLDKPAGPRRGWQVVNIKSGLSYRASAANMARRQLVTEE